MLQILILLPVLIGSFAVLLQLRLSALGLAPVKFDLPGKIELMMSLHEEIIETVLSNKKDVHKRSLLQSLANTRPPDVGT